MSFFVIFCSIFVFLLSCFLLKGTSKKVLLTYLLVWCAFVFLSSLNMYDLHEVSEKVLIYILISIICFSSGYIFLARTAPPSRCDCENYDDQVVKLMSSNKFRLLLMVTAIPLYIYAIRFLECYAELGAGQARLLTFTKGAIFPTYLSLQIHNYLAFPYFFILVSIFIFALFKKQLNFLTGALIIVNAVLYVMIGFGRLPIIQVCCCTIVALFVNRRLVSRQGRVKQKHKKLYLLMLFVFVLAFVLVFVITARRYNIETISLANIELIFDILFKQVYTYLVGSFRAFDYQLSHLSLFKFGRLTFNAIDEIIVMFLNLLGINTAFSGDGILQQNVPIGGGNTMNAFFTSLFQFYFDFGLIGVVLFSLLLGMIVQKVISWHEKEPTLPAFIMLSYFVYVTLMQPIKWELSSPSVLVLVIFCYIWHKKTKKKRLLLEVSE